MDLRLLRERPLFSGLSESECANALVILGAREKSYAKGGLLSKPCEPLRSFGMVLGGIVRVYMDDIEGNRMIMANVRAGETFGESLCYLGIEAPVHICAVTDAAVLWLSVERLRPGRASTPLEKEMAGRFTAMLAMRTLAMNDRIQILSKKSIRQKLIAFFSQHATGGGESFSVALDRNDMADYLGCDRSALSRELSKMKSEGIIRYDKSRFTLI